MRHHQRVLLLGGDDVQAARTCPRAACCASSCGSMRTAAVRLLLSIVGAIDLTVPRRSAFGNAGTDSCTDWPSATWPSCALVDVDHQLERRRHQRHDRRLRADQRAWRDQPLGDDAVDRRRDGRVADGRARPGRAARAPGRRPPAPPRGPGRCTDSAPCAAVRRPARPPAAAAGCRSRYTALAPCAAAAGLLDGRALGADVLLGARPLRPARAAGSPGRPPAWACCRSSSVGPACSWSRLRLVALEALARQRSPGRRRS